LLFSIRDTYHESLGFTPFEMLYGHTIRGPLQMLYEVWIGSIDKSETSVLKHVIDLKEQMQTVREVSQEVLLQNQNKMKTWFDKKARERSFNPGDEVLVLFPLVNQALSAKFQGPYVVKEKVNAVDYVISTPDRKKKTQLCHINMLKEYHSREKIMTNSIVLTGLDIESNLADDVTISNEPKLINSKVLLNFDVKVQHLSEKQKKNVKNIIDEFSDIFPDVPNQTNVIEHDVDVGESRPIKQHAYRVSPQKQDLIRKEVKYMIENNIIQPSYSNWSSPCLLVPKPDGGVRFCTDFRKVNAVTKSDVFPIPRIDDCIDQIGNANYVSKFDLLKGYWQIPLTMRAREISAFVTADGLFEYLVCPFGMKNSQATFQRLINQVIAGMHNCQAYVDDIVIYSSEWNEHIAQMKELFCRLSKAKLTVNLNKSDFGKATVVFLGHVVGGGQVKPLDAKVQAIDSFHIPTTKKQLMRFLGMAGYYRKFCRNFSTVTGPLTDLLKQNVKYVWTKECQNSFNKVKMMLKSKPVLSAPDFGKPFQVTIDASDIGAGSFLSQYDDNGVSHPVAYFSKKFNRHQKRFSTVEKETLSLLLALNHFEVYLCNPVEPIIVWTDHNPLVFVNKMRGKNQRLLRWSLQLSEYNLKICHVKGRENVVADALSRCY